MARPTVGNAGSVNPFQFAGGEMLGALPDIWNESAYTRNMSN